MDSIEPVLAASACDTTPQTPRHNLYIIMLFYNNIIDILINLSVMLYFSTIVMVPVIGT